MGIEIDAVPASRCSNQHRCSGRPGIGLRSIDLEPTRVAASDNTPGVIRNGLNISAKLRDEIVTEVTYALLVPGFEIVKLIGCDGPPGKRSFALPVVNST